MKPTITKKTIAQKTPRTINRIALLLFLVLALSGTTALASDIAAGIKTDQPCPATVKAIVLAKSTHSWDGNLLSAYPQGQPQVTILRIRIPAGAELPLHTHPVINAGVLISGQLTVTTTTGKTLQLNAGDPIIEVVNTWHSGKNPGSEPADIIVFYAGTTDAPITLKK
jgi:quercetin dioxygenase-like cupin family protein